MGLQHGQKHSEASPPGESPKRAHASLQPLRHGRAGWGFSTAHGHSERKSTSRLPGGPKQTKWDAAPVYGASVVGCLCDGASVVAPRGASVDGASVVGASVDGASVVGASVVGASVDSASNVGASAVGASVVGASVDSASNAGASVVGASVLGASVDSASNVGASAVGASVVGASVTVPPL